MVRKKFSNQEKIDREDKKMLTISLPNDLYQELLEKSGKGNVGNYVRKAVEEKLKEEEIELTKAYRVLKEIPEYQTINDGFFKGAQEGNDRQSISFEKKSQRRKREK